MFVRPNALSVKLTTFISSQLDGQLSYTFVVHCLECSHKGEWCEIVNCKLSRVKPYRRVVKAKTVFNQRSLVTIF